jgi:myo-inositol 2-dehydrogenase/D-chiro-inositol 1-dehydrogenase
VRDSDALLLKETKTVNNNPTQNKPQPLSRRTHVARATTAGAAGAAVGSLAVSRGAHAAGSDLIKLALIGCGGRGTGAATQALSNSAHSNVKLVAMADAFDDRLKSSLKRIDAKCPGQVDVPQERQFSGVECHRGAIECDPDMVLLCTPPGFRPMQFEAAVNAGKHVFMEKPVAVDSPGVRRVIAANELAKKKGLAVAVGLNGRHAQAAQKCIARIHDGAVGRIDCIRAYFNSSGVWVRPRRPDQTEMQYQVMNWYYFNWLSGDHIVEQHVHYLDASNWVKDDGHPIQANGMGGRQVRTDAAAVAEGNPVGSYGNIFDHHAVEFDYADGAKLFSYCRHMKGCWNNTGWTALGTKGSAGYGRGSTIVSPDGQPPEEFLRDKVDSHQTEHDHLFAALAAGQPYNEGEYGWKSTMTAILGRMATYSGKTVTWDDALNSNLDLSPAGYTWDSQPQPQPGEDGSYPIPMPGVTKAW